MNLDEAWAEYQKKEAALKAALANCEAEQAMGHMGLEPYQHARRLNDELTAFGAALAVKIDEALASLGVPAGTITTDR